MKARTYIPEERMGWWGGPDTQLRSDGPKVIFATELDAQRAAAKATARGEPMHSYRGRCGHMHIARTRRKRK